MQNQENQSQTSGLSGTIRMAPEQLPPESPISPPQVVPVGTSTPPPPPENPFVPKTTPNFAPPPTPRKSPNLGRFLMAIMLVGFLVGIIVLVAQLGAPKSPDVGPSSEVTINYWGFWENNSAMRTVISEFERTHPGIRVQYTQQSPIQYRERLQSAINGGEGPDVFRFHNTWVVMLRNQLSLVPATIMTPQDFASTYYPVASGDLVGGSAIYGLPMAIDGLGLIINEDLFTAAGVSIPNTWTDVMNIVPKLTVKNAQTIITSAIALGTANNVDYFSDIVGLMFMQNGANLTNLSGKEAEGTLIFYRKFSDTADPMYTWNENMDNSTNAFINGKVAMILAPSSKVADIKKANPKMRLRVAPVPQLAGNTVSWASYWVEGVSSRSQYQAQAWEFAKYLTSIEGSTLMYAEQTKVRGVGEPYARMDMASTIANDPITGAFVRQAPQARSFPLAWGTYDNGLNDKLIAVLRDAVNATQTGTQAAKAVEALSIGFRQVLAFYGLVTQAPVISP